ncbi:AAA domain-domain-containing protein [Phakopsora pachyrhizi]|uniref:DNA repair protein RAD50 n=1 Tax=Phakopsora pachyrhizi TaxID=170000 RepID=A0AAV0AGG5_PHAPC|nr:AAA domain-domain-containing protein [Phakopsora pachyrhizi]
MSSIDKIAIRGIRSFDSQSIAVMQFYSPLTVIVGQNGSGKTTIIECLKYITTGDLPPNTKGGAFVHDPGMAGESTVMAEVLLRFKNAAGTKLVASRRLQVSRRKNAGLTMKTLEGTLSYHDDKRSTQNSKRRTISTKCAEMDSELPRHLGISKAILENVIFCHQEDSNWPLSEPGTLKKKFDEIFEATKLTLFLNYLKKICKKKIHPGA